jgi:hypothetical protein
MLVQVLVAWYWGVVNISRAARQEPVDFLETGKQRSTRIIDGKKSSDLSAAVVEFPLVQIRDLQRCAGAKVGRDLLAPTPIPYFSTTP